MIEFTMPSLGADMVDATLVEWRKQIGDVVSRGDIIAEVETQKGLIEIEIFDEGIIENLLIAEGDKVPVGTVIAMIKPSESNDKPKKTFIKASPLAKRIAQENQIDLLQLTGTGPEGAITKDDVANAIDKRDQLKNLQAAEKMTIKKQVGTKPSYTETIRTAVANAMSRSNRDIPHYYVAKKIAMTNALSWLQQTNKQRTVQKRLLPISLLIKAVAMALREVPELNAIWENGLELKQDINIGFVVALRGGGVVIPTIRQADLKTVDEIMQALNDIIPRAKALKLRSSELSDATITLTQLSEGGADQVLGMIYPPQVAIIGFGSISEQPIAEHGKISIAPLMHVTVAGDHRATDGQSGSRFLMALNKYLQQVELW